MKDGILGNPGEAWSIVGLVSALLAVIAAVVYMVNAWRSDLFSPLTLNILGTTSIGLLGLTIICWTVWAYRSRTGRARTALPNDVFDVEGAFYGADGLLYVVVAGYESVSESKTMMARKRICVCLHSWKVFIGGFPGDTSSNNPGDASSNNAIGPGQYRLDVQEKRTIDRAAGEQKKTYRKSYTFVPIAPPADEGSGR